MSPAHALRLLGRQARWALPAGVFAGVAVPPLATALRPLLTAAVIGTLTAVLLRLERLAHHTRLTRGGFYHWIELQRAGG